MPVQWLLFPRSEKPVSSLLHLISAFTSNLDALGSHANELDSNSVLRIITPNLVAGGFKVETGKSKENKIAVPVLYGLNGAIEKCFFADAFHPGEGVVVEVEAGRAVDNNQFLKDLFQACMMQDAQHLAICVRNAYRGGNDFDSVARFLDTLYTSRRMQLPLTTVLLIGY